MNKGTKDRDSYISNDDVARPLTYAIKNGFEEYRRAEKWDHDFFHEARVPKCDCEASYLSKYTFASLMCYLNNLLELQINLGDIDQLQYRDSNSYSSLALRPNGGSAYAKDNAKTLRVHFDVMNNPKGEGKKNRLGSLYSEKKGSDAKPTFYNIYHTIGNFAPIPWWIEETYAGRGTYNLQALHNSLAEWWDALLLYLQWRMPSRKKGAGLSFEEYIILTCQFFYVDFGDELLRELNQGLSAKDFCSEIETGSTFPWTSRVRKWVQDMREQGSKGLKVISLREPARENMPITCLSPINHIQCNNNEKYGKAFARTFFANQQEALRGLSKKDGLIEIVDERIASLIEVRGRCILGLLKEAEMVRNTAT